MADIVVTEGYLAELADFQREAAEAAKRGGLVPAGVAGQCGTTHGLISKGSNEAMDPLTVARLEAAGALEQVSLWLAAALDTGGNLWPDIDQAVAHNFNTQMRNA